MRGTWHIVSAIWLTILPGCGNSGLGVTSDSAFSGTRADITGAIRSQTGGGDEMLAWQVVALEKDTGLARVAPVGPGGIFVLQQVQVDREQTLVLLSPNFTVKAVLSQVSTTPNAVHQYFTITDPYLPPLIYKAPILQMTTDDGVKFSRDLAADVDGDYIPDGIDVPSPFFGLTALNEAAMALQGAVGNDVDFDLDGIPNQEDVDIDNDGVPNVFDPNDDADELLDVFDQDANGDVIDDGVQQLRDAFYDEFVEYVAVELEVETLEDDSLSTSLIFSTQVRDNPTPLAVRVRGDESIFAAATIRRQDPETGAITPIAWDRHLLDDGSANDGNPNDRLFSQKVYLAANQLPRSHQVVFISLGFGNPETPWWVDVPFTFPNVQTSPVSSVFDPNTLTVTRLLNPFGEQLAFTWFVHIFDANTGEKIDESPAILGTDSIYQIPDYVMNPANAYQYQIIAQVNDIIPGKPPLRVKSKARAIEPAATPAP